MCAENVALERSLIDSPSVTTASGERAKNLTERQPRLIPEPPKFPSDHFSALEGRFNLQCNAGHRAFSPTPEEWYGGKCARESCAFPLHPLSPEGKLLPIPRNAKWRVD